MFKPGQLPGKRVLIADKRNTNSIGKKVDSLPQFCCGIIRGCSNLAAKNLKLVIQYDGPNGLIDTLKPYRTSKLILIEYLAAEVPFSTKRSVVLVFVPFPSHDIDNDFVYIQHFGSRKIEKVSKIQLLPYKFEPKEKERFRQSILHELQCRDFSTWLTVFKTQLILFKGPYAISPCRLYIYNNKTGRKEKCTLKTHDVFNRKIAVIYNQERTELIDPQLIQVEFDCTDEGLDGMLNGKVPDTRSSTRHSAPNSSRNTKTWVPPPWLNITSEYKEAFEKLKGKGNKSEKSSSTRRSSRGSSSSMSMSNGMHVSTSTLPKATNAPDYLSSLKSDLSPNSRICQYLNVTDFDSVSNSSLQSPTDAFAEIRSCSSSLETQPTATTRTMFNFSSAKDNIESLSHPNIPRQDALNEVTKVRNDSYIDKLKNSGKNKDCSYVEKKSTTEEKSNAEVKTQVKTEKPKRLNQLELLRVMYESPQKSPLYNEEVEQIESSNIQSDSLSNVSSTSLRSQGFITNDKKPTEESHVVTEDNVSCATANQTSQDQNVVFTNSSTEKATAISDIITEDRVRYSITNQTMQDQNVVFMNASTEKENEESHIAIEERPRHAMTNQNSQDQTIVLTNSSTTKATEESDVIMTDSVSHSTMNQTAQDQNVAVMYSSTEKVTEKSDVTTEDRLSCTIKNQTTQDQDVVFANPSTEKPIEESCVVAEENVSCATTNQTLQNQDVVFTNSSTKKEPEVSCVMLENSMGHATINQTSKDQNVFSTNSTEKATDISGVITEERPSLAVTNQTLQDQIVDFANSSTEKATKGSNVISDDKVSDAVTNQNTQDENVDFLNSSTEKAIAESGVIMEDSISHSTTNETSQEEGVLTNFATEKATEDSDVIIRYRVSHDVTNQASQDKDFMNSTAKATEESTVVLGNRVSHATTNPLPISSVVTANRESSSIMKDNINYTSTSQLMLDKDVAIQSYSAEKITSIVATNESTANETVSVISSANPLTSQMASQSVTFESPGSQWQQHWSYPITESILNQRGKLPSSLVFSQNVAGSITCKSSIQRRQALPGLAVPQTIPQPIPSESLKTHREQSSSTLVTSQAMLNSITSESSKCHREQLSTALVSSQTASLLTCLSSKTHREQPLSTPVISQAVPNLTTCNLSPSSAISQSDSNLVSVAPPTIHREQSSTTVTNIYLIATPAVTTSERKSCFSKSPTLKTSSNLCVVQPYNYQSPTKTNGLQIEETLTTTTNITTDSSMVTTSGIKEQPKSKKKNTQPRNMEKSNNTNRPQRRRSESKSAKRKAINKIEDKNGNFSFQANSSTQIRQHQASSAITTTAVSMGAIGHKDHPSFQGQSSPFFNTEFIQLLSTKRGESAFESIVHLQNFVKYKSHAYYQTCDFLSPSEKSFFDKTLRLVQKLPQLRDDRHSVSDIDDRTLQWEVIHNKLVAFIDECLNDAKKLKMLYESLGYGASFSASQSYGQSYSAQQVNQGDWYGKQGMNRTPYPQIHTQYQQTAQHNSRQDARHGSFNDINYSSETLTYQHQHSHVDIRQKAEQAKGTHSRHPHSLANQLPSKKTHGSSNSLLESILPNGYHLDPAQQGQRMNRSHSCQHTQTGATNQNTVLRSYSDPMSAFSHVAHTTDRLIPRIDMNLLRYSESVGPLDNTNSNSHQYFHLQDQRQHAGYPYYSDDQGVRCSQEPFSSSTPQSAHQIQTITYCSMHATSQKPIYSQTSSKSVSGKQGIAREAYGETLMNQPSAQVTSTPSSLSTLHASFDNQSMSTSNLQQPSQHHSMREKDEFQQPNKQTSKQNVQTTTKLRIDQTSNNMQPMPFGSDGIDGRNQQIQPTEDLETISTNAFHSQQTSSVVTFSSSSISTSKIHTSKSVEAFQTSLNHEDAKNVSKSDSELSTLPSKSTSYINTGVEESDLLQQISKREYLDSLSQTLNDLPDTSEMSDSSVFDSTGAASGTEEFSSPDNCDDEVKRKYREIVKEYIAYKQSLHKDSTKKRRKSRKSEEGSKKAVTSVIKQSPSKEENATGCSISRLEHKVTPEKLKDGNSSQITISTSPPQTHSLSSLFALTNNFAKTVEKLPLLAGHADDLSDLPMSSPIISHPRLSVITDNTKQKNKVIAKSRKDASDSNSFETKEDSESRVRFPKDPDTMIGVGTTEPIKSRVRYPKESGLLTVFNCTDLSPACWQLFFGNHRLLGAINVTDSELMPNALVDRSVDEASMQEIESRPVIEQYVDLGFEASVESRVTTCDQTNKSTRTIESLVSDNENKSETHLMPPSKRRQETPKRKPVKKFGIDTKFPSQIYIDPSDKASAEIKAQKALDKAKKRSMKNEALVSENEDEFQVPPPSKKQQEPPRKSYNKKTPIDKKLDQVLMMFQRETAEYLQRNKSTVKLNLDSPVNAGTIEMSLFGSQVETNHILSPDSGTYTASLFDNQKDSNSGSSTNTGAVNASLFQSRVTSSTTGTVEVSLFGKQGDSILESPTNTGICDMYLPGSQQNFNSAFVTTTGIAKTIDTVSRRNQGHDLHPLVKHFLYSNSTLGHSPGAISAQSPKIQEKQDFSNSVSRHIAAQSSTKPSFMIKDLINSCSNKEPTAPSHEGNENMLSTVATPKTYPSAIVSALLSHSASNSVFRIPKMQKVSLTKTPSTLTGSSSPSIKIPAVLNLKGERTRLTTLTPDISFGQNRSEKMASEWLKNINENVKARNLNINSRKRTPSDASVVERISEIRKSLDQNPNKDTSNLKGTSADISPMSQGTNKDKTKVKGTSKQKRNSGLHKTQKSTTKETIVVRRSRRSGVNDTQARIHQCQENSYDSSDDDIDGDGQRYYDEDYFVSHGESTVSQEEYTDSQEERPDSQEENSESQEENSEFQEECSESQDECLESHGKPSKSKVECPRLQPVKPLTKIHIASGKKIATNGSPSYSSAKTLKLNSPKDLALQHLIRNLSMPTPIQNLKQTPTSSQGESSTPTNNCSVRINVKDLVANKGNARVVLLKAPGNIHTNYGKVITLSDFTSRLQQGKVILGDTSKPSSQPTVSNMSPPMQLKQSKVVLRDCASAKSSDVEDTMLMKRGKQSPSKTMTQSKMSKANKRNKDGEPSAKRHKKKKYWYPKNEEDSDQELLSVQTGKRKCEETLAELAVRSKRLFFLQKKICKAYPPNIARCLDCKHDGEDMSNYDENELTCRFTMFRRLMKTENGRLRPAGFSTTEAAEDTDLIHWKFQDNTTLYLETCKKILVEIGAQFEQLVLQEQEACTWQKKTGKPAWKRAVLRVREMCDICATTIFNTHWTCENCGFGVCLDCFFVKLKKQGKTDPWMDCYDTDVEHKPRDMRVTEIIPKNLLQDLYDDLLNTCKKIDLKFNKLDLLEFSHHRSSSLDLLKSNIKWEEGPLAEQGAIERNMSAGLENVVPSTPSECTWYCDGRMLHINNSSFSSQAMSLFKSEWAKGKPILVSNVHHNLNPDLWTPQSFEREFGEELNDVVNCFDGSVMEKLPISQFWKGFESIKDRPVCKEPVALLKLKDWPPGSDFKDKLPNRFNDIMQALPAPVYTHRNGELNLSARLPDFFAVPDLGPKMYNAYGSASYPSAGTTNLHLDISDATNTIAYVGIPHDEGYREQEIADTFTTVDRACCEETQKRIRDPSVRPGALWHIFPAHSADKMRQFMKRISVERGCPTSESCDPIHDQALYLDQQLLDRLREEEGVEGYAICQCLGDAVFIPAGAPHQVLNLHSCVKIAEDFVAPEHITHCFQLTQEFRHLSDYHTNHEDKLQIKNIIYHSIKDCLGVVKREYGYV